jgi:prolyl oligopeptidase
MAAMAVLAACPAAADPPVAQIRPVAETYGKTTIIDNYRWMEAPDSAELKAYMQASSAIASADLARIPGRDRLRHTIDALSVPAVTVTSVTPDGEQLFYLKRGPGDDVAHLVARTASGGDELLLVDPEALPDVKPHTEIGQIFPSQDGSHVAYTLTDSGPDSAVLRILDVRRHTTLPERITGARFAALAWNAEGNGFYYTHAELGVDSGAAASSAGAAATKPPLRLAVYLHKLGNDPSQDTLILSGSRLPFEFHGANVIPRLVLPPSSDYALAVISDGVSPDLAVYAAPVAQLDQIPAPWQNLANQSDGVIEVAPSFSIAFMLTHSGADRLRIVSEDMADPGFDKTRTVLPEGDGVVTGIAAAADALFVARRDGVGMHLLRLSYNDSTPDEVRLPFTGTIPPSFGGPGGLVADPRSSGVLFSLAGWTHPQTWMRYDQKVHRVQDIGLVPPFPKDLSGYDTVETTAKGRDGTNIPLSIIMRHGTPMDHARPALVQAYGSYGYSFDPRFMPAAIAWADEGGVYAIAHVRGGGEFGEAWHAAGRFANKVNTASDMLACAYALTAAGYTDAAHLTAFGENAGALAAANAMIRAPSAFRAVALQAGLANPMRAYAYPGGDMAAAEFGTPTNPAQLPLVFAVDALNQVQDGVEYPAVLLSTAPTDREIPPWQSAKLAARLQAATTSGRPVLLFVPPDLTTTAAARSAADADRMAFLLWQVGAPGFQPGAAGSSGEKQRHKRRLGGHAAPPDPRL